ncbi:MAG: homogentisate 1,2-dioxygenase [Alphaproteobacteria bacterium CG_4_9_14_3_um_filter_47_13]|nr:MAG: homogentisate 1,2-dioxygenase [Alphaproteobacteria bacterium CG_4_9_14_3_um_filter_47_13]
MTQLHYNSGFGNEFATEALKDALPQGKNSPQKVNYGLYAEQLSGAPFTAPRHQNKRSWLYRIRPSAGHDPFKPYKHKTLRSTPFNEVTTSPDQFRWDPPPVPTQTTDFIDGLHTMAGGGDSASWTGLGVHIYAANQSMTLSKRFFYNADGEMLFVPQQGRLHLRTECGEIMADPGEIAVIPRGIRFAVDFPEGGSRGYVCENYGALFTLPDLGPIGANGLANPRDFLTPVAAFEDIDDTFELIAKFSGQLWHTMIDHSPLDVVAWHGNYAPYKYDLAKFNVINTVSFDHPDPSIFTVLTSPSYPPGTANIDFVIFPPRWMVAEETFRPPYFHRNIMSEFMGLIHGVYDAKESGGFVPGGSSLHNCMSAHGPDAGTFEKASNATLKPQYMDKTLAFMFESRYIMRPTNYAMESGTLQKDYYKCWSDISKIFQGNQ